MITVIILLIVGLGGYLGYKFLQKDAELQIRYQALAYLLGMDKEQAKKWLDTKNPGCALRKPSELNFPEMWDFASKIRK